MKLVEGQWKLLEQERTQVLECKKRFFVHDKTNRLADEKKSMRCQGALYRAE
jgi:hypothetical protein